MRYVSLWFFAVLLTGCPTRAKLTGTDAGGSQDAGDSGPSPNTDAAEGGTDAGPPAIAIVSPPDMTFTNGTVDIEVQVSGGTATKVQLLRNDTAWQELSGPPFTFSWSTAAAPDGPYVLTATATVDGQLVSSTPLTITVDHTSPMVIGMTPASGSASVELTAPIQVTFSEAIAPATVNDGAVQLTIGGTTVASTVALAADAKSLTVTITSPSVLTLPADFRATIAATITDRAGNPLAPITAPWTWTVPAWIKLPPLTTVTPPRLALDANRRPVIAYATLDTVNANSVYDLRVARFEGNAWNTSMGAPTTAVDTARNGYSLDLDSKGQPVVAWTETFGETVVHVGAWTGSSWNSAFPALNAIKDVGKDGSLPSVRVDSADHPVVAWREVTGNFPTYDAFVARWDGTSWTSFVGSGFQGGAGFERLADGPQLVLDKHDNPSFGWFDVSVGSGVAIWNGTDWAHGQALTGGFTPYPVLDANGIPLIAIRGPDLHVDKWNPPLLNWVPVVMNLTTSSSWSAPRLAFANDGAPIAAWLDTSNGVRIGVARWTGTSWDTRFGTFNAGQNPLNNIVPELAVDAKGKIWVAWLEGPAAQVWMSNY